MMLRRVFFIICFSLISGAIALPAWAQPAGAKGENFLYRVIAGDTLGDLAQRFTTGQSNWGQLQQLNEVSDPARLPIALLLRIPFAIIPVVPAQATVHHVAGNVTADGQPLSKGDAITEGQRIATQEDGFVTLELADGSILSIPPSSSLTLARVRQFKGTGLIDTIFAMEQGTVETHVAPQKTGVGRFEVRTPVSVTGVRGTRLRVHVSDTGSRSEVVYGQAHVDSATTQEIALRDEQGVAVDPAGHHSGVRELLPAPVLSTPRRSPSGWTVDFPDVAGAAAYLVRVTADAAGTQIVSRQIFNTNDVEFSGPGPGTWHAFVRALDELGIGGLDSHVPFEGRLVLQSNEGPPVLSGSGALIAVADY